MNLEQLTIPFSTKLILNAYDELHAYEQEKSDTKCIWGYFPGLAGNEPSLYPKCEELRQALDSLLSVRPESKDMKVSFIKIASRKPPMEFGGLHLDDRASPTEEPDPHARIMRMILNLGTHPRSLRYGKATTRESFEANENIPTEVIDIPGRKDDKIWALVFCASEIPHVGVTSDEGYFIAAYGGL